MYKKAFTIVEFIFVIVVLGILSFVAIPKLSATRDDSTITACVNDIKTAVDDIINYTLAKGDTPIFTNNYTNVDLQVDNTNYFRVRTTGGNYRAHYTPINYYCGRERDSTTPSVILLIIKFSKSVIADVYMGISTFQNINFTAGEVKIFVIDLNSSNNIDKLLQKRLSKIGLKSSPLSIGNGIKAKY